MDVPDTDSNDAAPLLLVHGMCCTGQVWHNYLEYFESRGHQVFAPTLKPHLRRRGWWPRWGLLRLRFQDYVDQIHEEIDRIEASTGQLPVLIGHSMGGLVAQVVAQSNRVRAAVFVSSAAPVGARPPEMVRFWRLIRLQLITLPIWPFAWIAKRAALNLLDAAAKTRAAAAMVWESGRAFKDIATVRVDESAIRVPVLTVAAGQDRLVPAKAARATHDKYRSIGGEYLEFQDHAHWIYDEPGWEKPAAALLAWIQQKCHPVAQTPGGSS